MINVLASSTAYSGVNPGSDEKNTIKRIFPTSPLSDQHYTVREKTS